jgi:hypothetical protein
MEPRSLVGSVITAVVVGWHVHGDDRSQQRLFIEIDGHRVIEARTKGDGPLRLEETAVPIAFDMAEYGRYEFMAASHDHPLAPLVGEAVTTAQEVVRHGTPVGVTMTGGPHSVVIWHDADELLVTQGTLEPDEA